MDDDLLPEPAWLTLVEAAKLVQARYPRATAKEIERVMLDLFEAEDVRVEARCRSYSGHDGRLTILGAGWDRVEFAWENNQFATPTGRYGQFHIFKDVRVNRSDLVECLGAQQAPAPASTTPPPYRSPFVDLLLKAENHFRERLAEAKAEEIRAWLSQRGKEVDPMWSQNKSAMMATFLRHPDLQKGGNKPRKVRTSSPHQAKG